MTTFTDEVRETVSPHKFGGSRMAAACWLLSLDGCADEETGDATDWQYHVARIGRRLLYTDEQGFVWVDSYDSELQAVRAFEADDRAYGEAVEARDEEDRLYGEGYVESESVGVLEFHPGEAVRAEGHAGVAFRVDRVASQEGPNTAWTGIRWWNPQRRVCHMIGDDVEYEFDVLELSPLDDDDYCSSCGQIGCSWH